MIVAGIILAIVAFLRYSIWSKSTSIYQKIAIATNSSQSSGRYHQADDPGWGARELGEEAGRWWGGSGEAGGEVEQHQARCALEEHTGTGISRTIWLFNQFFSTMCLMHFCLLWPVRWESRKIDCFALVCTISGENGPQAGELPACAQSQVRMRWEWCENVCTEHNLKWEWVVSLFARAPPRNPNEPNERPHVTFFPLSMFSTSACKWSSQKFKRRGLGEKMETEFTSRQQKMTT